MDGGFVNRDCDPTGKIGRDDAAVFIYVIIQATGDVPLERGGRAGLIISSID